MFTVIIWKHNFEKLTRTGANASLNPIVPITISILTSKLLRNSNFSQRHRVFLVLLYQIDTSNDFIRRYLPFSMNVVYYIYEIISFPMAKIEKYL